MDQAQILNKMTGWRKLIKILLGGLLALQIIVQILAPVQVSAQSGSGVPGLRNCNFSAGKSGSGTSAIGTCLRDIFNFVFVVALFAIAIRVAVLALNNYNPFNNGNADKQAISLVWDVTLGLILIGGPAIILNTINPASLNLNILNVGRLGSNSGGSGGSSTGSSSSSGSDSKNSLNFNNGVITDTKFNDAVDKIKSPVTDDSTANQNNIQTNPVLALFQPINVYSQSNNSQDQLSLQQAQQVVKDVLTVENRCKYWIIDRTDLQNCQVLANSDGFKKGLAKLADSERKSLVNLNDSPLYFTGTLVTNRELEVKPTTIAPTATRQPGCNFYYAQIMVKNDQDGAWSIVYAKICNGQLQNSAIWQTTNGQITPKTGTIAAGGNLFDSSQTLYILN
jgi:hypothetical protein